ncbi:MFS transporter [Streptomyces sp. NPDC058001]|uniref:MFS transporter n=1 Tax=Streptomyces sp. NPDC058001 TaxID=3346300 RepID=UPI0036E7111B
MTSLSLGHACVDIYQGAVAALVPFFVSERAYSYAAASTVVLAASLLSSVVQPLFGVLTDKWAMPWLVPVSTMAGGAGVALAGVSDSYTVTLVVVAISGIGVAAYHPEAARVARRVSRGSHSAMGWYSLGGNLGFAAAPLLVWGVMAVGGLRASPLLIVPALAGAALSVAALRGMKARTTTTATLHTGHTIDPHADQAAAPHTGEATSEVATPHAGQPPAQDDWTSFLKLSGAIVCRSIVFVGLSAFVSLYVRRRTGGGEASGTAALVVLYLGGALGTVAGGTLATRYGRLPVVRWSYALTVPAVAGAVFVPGPLLYGFIALTSAGLYLPFSLHITLGQDYLPRRVGTASGVTLGLTVSIGGIATPLIGAAADATSLQTALVPLIALPALGWLLLRTLSEPDTLEAVTRDAPRPPQDAPRPPQDALRPPVGPTPVGPTPVGPTPVGPTPVGPTPVGPTPVGPAPITPAGTGDAPAGTTPPGPRK